MCFETAEQADHTSRNKSQDVPEIEVNGLPIYYNDGQGNFIPTGSHLAGDVVFPTAHDYNILSEELKGATNYATELERINKLLEKKVLDLEATNLSGSKINFEMNFQALGT